VARLAKEMLPELSITLIDSRQVSMCTGWLAIIAARAAREGKSLEEIMALMRDAIPRLRLLAVVQDLRYLQHSGRVNWVSGMLGTMLQIKPLSLIQDGQANPAERVRTQARVLERFEQKILSYRPLQELAVLHVGAPELAGEIAARLAPQLGNTPPVMEAGVVVGTHAGPGAVGAACVLGRA
jgi:DegV family protein with EDD domain